MLAIVSVVTPLQYQDITIADLLNNTDPYPHLFHYPKWFSLADISASKPTSDWLLAHHWDHVPEASIQQVSMR